MSTQAAPCPILDTDLSVERKALFDDLDKRAKVIEERWRSTWVDLAQICQTMRDNNLWREGGFSSFNGWLLSACPTSRSMAYLAMGMLEELKDISVDDLKQIPLGSAEILRSLSKSARGDRKLLASAKSRPPRELRSQVIRDMPEEHLETFVSTKYNFQCSQLKVVEAALEMYRMLHPDGDYSDEGVIEAWASEYMLSHQTEWEQCR